MEYFTGDLGAGGAAECAVELQFKGRLGEAFTSFAVRRAKRLSLRGWITPSGYDCVTVVAEGPQALVDAFELVCTLGPIESQVETWTRAELDTGINSQLFEVRAQR